MVSTTGQIDGGLQNYRVQATGSSSYFNTPDIINRKSSENFNEIPNLG